MAEQELQIGWTVNKKYGYISEITWSRDGDKHVAVHHFTNKGGLFGPVELICTDESDEEPYENADAWVFLSEDRMLAWLRSESHVVSTKLNHYLNKLSKYDTAANFLTNVIWPENFIIGHTPKDYKNHTSVHISGRRFSEYSLQFIVQYAEHQLGMPLSKFQRVWCRFEYGLYCNELNVVLTVESKEHRAYFSKHVKAIDKIQDNIECALRRKCPSLKYHITMHKTPRYLFGDDKYFVDAKNADFDNNFLKVLGNNIKSKIGVATRRKNPDDSSHKTRTCGYLISDDMIDKVPPHIMNSALIIPYAFVTQKCYVLTEPIKISVWCRPNKTLIVDALLPVGSASLTKFNDTLSSVNIIDQFWESEIDT